MTTNSLFSNVPNGSRVQRARRHLAEQRRASLVRLSEGRTEAIEALTVYARRQALPARPEVPQVAGRMRRRLYDLGARLVARKIERDTYRARLNCLEDLKLGVDAWLRAMKDVPRSLRPGPVDVQITLG